MVPSQTVSPPFEPELYNYEIVQEFEHNPSAFTQGLVYERFCSNPEDPATCKDAFLESTGLWGKSVVRRWELGSGEVLQETKLGSRHFGEGLAAYKDSLYQLTWQSNIGFQYNAGTLEQEREFRTPLKDGWGLTTINGSLVATDSGTDLFFLDPENDLALTKQVTVTDGGKPVRWVNELQYIDGEIWANIWQTECIARIQPETGRVNSWVLFHGLRKKVIQDTQRRIDVLNGIGYDPDTKRIYVTGKQWPKLFEVKIHKISDVSPELVGRARKLCIAN